MARVAIAAVSVARRFEDRHYTGCDGYPAASLFDVVYVEARDGREFYLPNAEKRYDDEEGESWFAARYEAAAMEAKVRARGSIDPDHWVELEPQPSLEERFADEAYREAVERYEMTGSIFG